MRWIGRIAVLAALPLLAGCLDMVQSVVVNRDGTATVGVEMAVASDIFPMMFETEEEFCAPEPDDGLPPSFTTAVERSTRDMLEVCTMTATGPLNELAALLAEGGLLPDEDGGTPVTTLVDEGGGIYTYSLVFTLAPEDAAMPFDPNAPDLPPEVAQMLAMMEGHFLTWTVTAPRILETTGTLDGNTASYQIPLVDLITGTGSGEHVFTVRFSVN